MEYLFSYGTLQKENVQLNLFGRVLTGSKDVLHGYKTSPIVINDPAFLGRGEKMHQRIAKISKDATDSIEGMVLEVSAEELRLTDSYEPVDYQRIKVALRSGREAWIYAAR